MSQKAIVDWLAANPGWHTNDQIAQGVGVALYNTQHETHVLRSYREIQGQSVIIDGKRKWVYRAI